MTGCITYMYTLYTPGIGGLLLGSTMRPMEPTVGGGGAVSGFVAVYLIELFQSWSLVPKPCRALMKLLGIIVLFGLSGLLPQVFDKLNLNAVKSLPANLICRLRYAAFDV